MGDDTMPGPNTNYHYLTHHAMRDNVKNAHPEQAHTAGQTWTEGSQALQRLGSGVRSALNTVSSSWKGPAAERVYAHMTQTADFAEKTGETGGTINDASAVSGEVTSKTANAMPEPINVDVNKGATDALVKAMTGDPIGGADDMKKVEADHKKALEAKQQAVDLSQQRADANYQTTQAPMTFDDPPTLDSASSAVQHHHAASSGSPSHDSSTTSSGATSAASTTATPTSGAPGGAPSSVGSSPANIGSAAGSSGGTSGGPTVNPFGSPNSPTGTPGTTAVPPAANAGGSPTTGSIGGRIGSPGSLGSPGAFGSGATSGVSPVSGGLGTGSSASGLRTGGASFPPVDPSVAGGAAGRGGAAFQRSQASRFSGLNEGEKLPPEEKVPPKAGSRVSGESSKGAGANRLAQGAKGGAAAEESAGPRAAKAAGTSVKGGTPGATGAGAGKGKKGEDDKEHEDKYGDYVKSDELVGGDDPLRDEEKGYAVDPTTGNTVTPEAIGDKLDPIKPASERPAPQATSASSYSPPTPSAAPGTGHASSSSPGEPTNAPDPVEENQESVVAESKEESAKKQASSFVVPMATPIPPERR